MIRLLSAIRELFCSVLKSKKKRRRSFRRYDAEVLEKRHAMSGFSATFDFGTKSSPLGAGDVQVTESTKFTAALGYGWTAGSILSGDRGGSSALNRDYNYTTDGTFAVNVPAGSYQVSMVLGDLGPYAHDNMGIFLEGTQFGTVSTSAKQVVTVNYTVDVADSQFTLHLKDLGGNDKYVVMEGLSLSYAGPIFPTLSMNDVTMMEAQSGEQDMVFTANLSQASGSDVSVVYSTSNGTAHAGSQYTAATGILTIPAGQTQGTITIATEGGTVVDSDDTFAINLSNPNGLKLARTQITGNILNEGTLTVSASATTFTEGAAGAASTGTVTRVGKTDMDLMVNLYSSNTDAATVPVTVVIPAGQSSATFSIFAPDNSVLNETRKVTITAAADLFTSGALGVVVNDDEKPPFSANYDFGTRSSPGTTGYTQVTDATKFTAALGYGWSAGSILSGDRGGASTITRDYNYTSDGTFSVNVPNGTYQVSMELGDLGSYAHDNMGIFLEGTQVGTVSTTAKQVVTVPYTVDVADSQFTLRLKDLGGKDPYVVIEALSLTYISPLLPTLTVNDVSMMESESGEQDMVFTANLSHASAKDVSVSFATGDGTAAAGTQYTAASGVLTIPAGQTQGTITIATQGGTVIDADDTFFINLTNPSGLKLPRTQIVGNILNEGTLSITVSTNVFLQGTSGVVSTGTVTLVGNNNADLVVNLTSSNPNAASVPATVTIPAGKNTATFNILAPNAAAPNLPQNNSAQQTVTITAAAHLYTAGAANVYVDSANAPAYLASYDFGTKSSPVSPGFRQVTDTTAYTTALGYGWTAGKIASTDRGGTSLLDRDFDYTADGTFVANVPNGRYQVDILMGDAGGYAHDLMGVILQGQQVDAVTTVAGQIVSKSYQVEVINGQVKLELKDLGGKDPWAVIEGLRIHTAGLPLNTETTYWPVTSTIPGATFSEQTVDSNGFISYSITSQYERTANAVRVLLPSNYDPSKQYHIVYVLPVDPGTTRQFGDGLTVIRAAGMQNTYNAIFVSPDISDMPWYADNATNSQIWQETYFKTVVVPFIESKYSSIAGADGRYLLGFSKSGYGAMSMFLRSPDYYGKVVDWDSPIAMTDPNTGYGFMGILGSMQNFTQNYQVTTLIQRDASVLQGTTPRIFLLGYSNQYSFYVDHAQVDAELTKLGIPHYYTKGTLMAHNWTSGWLPGAVLQLFKPQ